MFWSPFLKSTWYKNRNEGSIKTSEWAQVHGLPLCHHFHTLLTLRSPMNDEFRNANFLKRWIIRFWNENFQCYRVIHLSCQTHVLKIYLVLNNRHWHFQSHTMRLYESLFGPLVSWSTGPSICPSIHLSVHLSVCHELVIKMFLTFYKTIYRF